MKTLSPYSNFPDYCFWKRAVSSIVPTDLDPMVSVPFHIEKSSKVATAGSCFAQHVARYLRNSGFNLLVTEPAHPIISEEDAVAFNYGTYTARFGNIYTARQLLQLFKRAYGQFLPIENVWEGNEGHFIDPFRPQIQPNGFETLSEFKTDRDQHLCAVREAFETLDVFIFTLGLTECWEAIADGAVFPLCPGVAGGVFDPSKYRLHNFNVSEVVADTLEFVDLLKTVNPKAKIILTVSPVPLIATAESNQHVLVANTYSKSVLRVACQEVVSQRADTTYFPSYEIITGNYSRGVYFASDCRQIIESGVSHVMRIFLKHFSNEDISNDCPTNTFKSLPNDHDKDMQELVKINCDEESIR
jgi:hypothetical protein